MFVMKLYNIYANMLINKNCLGFQVQNTFASNADCKIFSLGGEVLYNGTQFIRNVKGIHDSKLKVQFVFCIIRNSKISYYYIGNVFSVKRYK